VTHTAEECFDELVSGGDETADGQRCRKHHTNDGFCGEPRPVFDTPNKQGTHEECGYAAQDWMNS
jgi:hypothetical protein